MLLRIQSHNVVLATLVISGVIATGTTHITPVFANQVRVSSPAKDTKTIVVNKSEFGVLRAEKNGSVTLIPTTQVPLQEGKQYGWRIHLKNYTGEVTWREVLRLPKLPATWDTQNGENFSIRASGVEGVTTRTQLAKDGVISNSWTIVSGDPIGKYIIEVYLDNRRIGSFEFEVVSPKKQRLISI